MDQHQPLRIAMIGLRGLPASWGGVERHVEELGARLVERGHEVTVYCRAGYAREELAEHRGMRLLHHRTAQRMGVEALVHSAIAAAHSVRHPYDVVHFHAVGPGLVAPLPRFLSRAAVVQTVHGLDADRQKWGRGAAALLRAATWSSAHVPNTTVTVSRALREHYAQRYGRQAVYVQNGVTPGPRPSAEHLRERFGLEPGSYVLHVGRLVPEKAADVLVRAFASVPGDTRLVLAGGSSHTDGYCEEVERLAEADPRVVLPGYVFGDDLAALYAHARAFVLPSHLEGLPLTLLEAASYGLPLIASSIPPHLEVLQRDRPGARLVAPGDVEGLAGALTRVLEDPATEQAGAALVREAVLGHYDWDLAAELTELVYLRALGRDVVLGLDRPERVHAAAAAPYQREPVPEEPVDEAATNAAAAQPAGR